VNYLSAEKIGKSFSDRWLFRDLTFGIAQGEKYAMVGINGVGKSTLLKILNGSMPPDEGTIAVRDGLRIGTLAQQEFADSSLTIKAVLFSDTNELARAVRDYEMCVDDPNTSAERMHEVLDEMERLSAWEYEAKVKEIIEKLGVPSLSRELSTLSGGQRKRVYMAKLLLELPDLIFLDEPTNHLDLESIEWLENYLSGKSITLVMVTHDRYFLDNVVTDILELDRQQLFRYTGNYAYFLEMKAGREEKLQVEVTKARNLLKKELEWMRRQPKARGTKAKYRIEAFHDLEKKASQDLRRDKLELTLEMRRQGGNILSLVNVEKSFGNDTLIDDFSYVFKKGDRVGVVGKNGVGKSTLLDLMVGLIRPDKGEVVPGVTTRFGYFTQEAANLRDDNRVIEEVTAIAEFVTLSDGSQVSASRFLDMFLFPPDKQYNLVGKLSGGERKRLQLLKVLVGNPNFLILDEPTNDFDIETLNVLEEFLVKFNGCLVLVSHDRYFMDHLVEQLFVFEADGIVRVHNGNYSDYRLALEDYERPTISPVVQLPEVKQERVQRQEQQRKLTYKEKQDYAALEKDIELLEDRKATITEQLTAGAGDHTQLQKWSEEIALLTQHIDDKTNRWLVLTEKAGD
jgi:ATP-binding cassette subfamily F protein uup